MILYCTLILQFVKAKCFIIDFTNPSQPTIYVPLVFFIILIYMYFNMKATLILLRIQIIKKQMFYNKQVELVNR